MRKTILTAIALSFTALPVLADPVHGIWQTRPDDNGNFGHVRMQTCSNGKICGGLIAAFDGSGQQIESENVGRALVWDMEPQGDGQYREGRVWAPDRDRTYNARMELRGDTLGVSGCILMVCREQEWTRLQ
jgi:uncharacterized protein (DUF2147 family)